jgi:hypothetical protein
MGNVAAEEGPLTVRAGRCRIRFTFIVRNSAWI